MKTNGTPSATWDAMTDQQKIEWLAVKVMGWRRIQTDRGFDWCDERHIKADGKYWNPLTDWNHWRQVEEKVMEDDRLMKRYGTSLRREMENVGMTYYFMPNLRTRTKALFLALNAK